MLAAMIGMTHQWDRKVYVFTLIMSERNDRDTLMDSHSVNVSNGQFSHSNMHLISILSI